MGWNPIERIIEIDRAIWTTPLDALPRWRSRLLRAIRFALVLIRDVVQGQLTLRAMSLVYTTLLSIVPLLALSFSVLKAFGVHNQTEPMLRQLLAPLGEQGEELSRQIIGFIENMNVGVLGSAGLALLLYTAVSLVQKLEESFNYIWHISESRSMGERFSRYLSVLLVGPILVFSAFGITATVMNVAVVQELLAIAPLGHVLSVVGKVMPYLLVIAAFTFVYVFIPNTRVEFTPALAGGVVGGVLWQSAGWAFAAFVAASTKYPAIYSGFAIVLLSLIWIYVSWLILLFGASVAFYTQHPEYLVAESGEPRLSNRMRERLALVVMSTIATRYVRGQAGWTLPQLTQTLGVPMHAIQIVLSALQDGKILAESNDQPPVYLPARDLDEVSVKDLLDCVRSAGEDRYLSPDALPVTQPVDSVIRRLEEAAGAAAGSVGVKDLISDLPQRGAALQDGADRHSDLGPASGSPTADDDRAHALARRSA